MIPRKAADVRSWQQILKTTTTLHTCSKNGRHKTKYRGHRHHVVKRARLHTQQHTILPTACVFMGPVRRQALSNPLYRWSSLQAYLALARRHAFGTHCSTDSVSVGSHHLKIIHVNDLDGHAAARNLRSTKRISLKWSGDRRYKRCQSGGKLQPQTSCHNVTLDMRIQILI